MRERGYNPIAHGNGYPGLDWRWRRATEVANGDPHDGQYLDDPVTLRAARYLSDAAGPDLDDIRDAVAVHAAGGLQERAVRVYLLANMSDDEVAAHAGLSPAAVAAYCALFFATRGAGPLGRELRAVALTADDPLVKAARRGGPRLVEARVRFEAGDRTLSAELAERFELDDLLDDLLGRGKLGKYVKAAVRLDAVRRLGGRS